MLFRESFKGKPDLNGKECQKEFLRLSNPFCFLLDKIPVLSLAGALKLKVFLFVSAISVVESSLLFFGAASRRGERE